MAEEAFERKLALLRACWTYFDETYPRVSAELRKGQRGSGRDRDQIVRHTYGSESEFARKIGIRDDPERTPEGLRVYREDYQNAIRALNGEGKPART